MKAGSWYYQRDPSREWYRTALSSTAIVICVITSTFVQGILARGVAIPTDCWYENERHPDGYEVATSEPCLNCTCRRGALLCYLRVCPRFPNPPPPGCILLHRYRTCCPELVCTDFTGETNSLEARSDTDVGLNLELDSTIPQNACIHNGTVYGPGSAMRSSSFCEYCYCLGGNQTCIKLKCLDQIEGCTPIYDQYSCCPIKYNCTRLGTTSSTTTELPRDTLEKGGCVVDGSFYPEGSKVIGVGHSVCDNCYCIEGLLRCEPLSCAPALLGCTPTIKPGNCCAASYNCSGKIEIQPEPYYGHYPTVSKEYAKLRKVNQEHPMRVVTVSPFYVQEIYPKQRGTGTFGTTRHFTGVVLDNNTMKPNNKDTKSSTSNYFNTNTNFPGTYHATTNYESKNTNYKGVFTTTYRPKPPQTSSQRSVDSITTIAKEEQTNASDMLDILNFFESLLDKDFNETFDTTTVTVNSVDNATEGISTTSGIFTTTLEDAESTINTITEPATTEIYTSTEDIAITTDSSSETPPHTITLKMVLKSTDCKVDMLESNKLEVTTLLPVDPNEINKLGEIRRTAIEDYTSTTEELNSNENTLTTKTIPRNNTRVVSSATLKNIPGKDVILNTSKAKGEDYDYEYGEPTLPPSLPNLRIIPFVAADALDSKKNTGKGRPTDSIEQRITKDSSGYNNLFSPPVETEGGFVPKNPPVLNDNYKNTVTGPATTKEHTGNVHCMNHDGTQVIHGQAVASQAPCMTCACFYGNIVCQNLACPLPGPNCKKTELTLCCPHYTCNEQPVVVMDHLGNSAVHLETHEIPIVPPFSDVIRTEPAPNLESLISDMMPFLTRKSTEKSTDTTTERTSVFPEDLLSLDKVLQLFSNPESTTRTEVMQIQKPSSPQNDLPRNTTEMKKTITHPSSAKDKTTTDGTDTDISQNMVSVAPSTVRESNSTQTRSDGETKAGAFQLINLAGCNIYGRMYRVGRIISELSDSCRECRCTEVGVECIQLKC